MKLLLRKVSDIYENLQHEIFNESSYNQSILEISLIGWIVKIDKI